MADFMPYPKEPANELSECDYLIDEMLSEYEQLKKDIDCTYSIVYGHEEI
jgi:hypothetical protein